MIYWNVMFKNDNKHTASAFVKIGGILVISRDQQNWSQIGGRRKF
jgi:hypothetical protein